MGIFDRIILTIYTVALTFISAAFVALAAGWHVPLDYMRKAIVDPNGRWVVGIAGSVFFIASVRLLYFAFRRTGKNRSLLHETELGEVRVSLDAVENLVARVAILQRGVREVKARAEAADGRVVVSLRIWVTPDTSIPEVGTLLQREVARQVRNVIGAEVAQVRLHVVNITAESRRGKVE